MGLLSKRIVSDKPHYYELKLVNSDELLDGYMELLQDVYRPLGFLESKTVNFLPSEHDEKFILFRKGKRVGIFCLRDVLPRHQHFSVYLPGLAEGNEKAIEINNVILDKDYRGSVGLTMILYKAVLYGYERGYHYLVGITRYNTLRNFVDAGATPIYHEPIHILGKQSIKDFIVYFDLKDPAAMNYAHERAKRLLHQIGIMNAIRHDFINNHKTSELAVGQ